MISAFIMMTGISLAEPIDLTTALQNTYINCVGINDDLHDMKVLAGINTAITGVGTGLGIGAVAVGISKSNTDKKIETIEELLKKIEEKSKGKISDFDSDIAWQKFLDSYQIASANINIDTNTYAELNKKSKRLGHWRTGLLAANTATNVAGVIIANKNKIDKDLNKQIDDCVASVHDLQTAITAARANNEDIDEAHQIYSACREYEYIDLSSINTRASGATISSAVGIVTGGIGTATSAIANSDKVRNDNSVTGKNKEKNLNTASNIFAGGATVASGIATIFNATQIAAIKKIATVAEKCTEVLK